jgi:hypothetical protein
MGCKCSKLILEDFYEDVDGNSSEKLDFDTFEPRKDVCSYSYHNMKLKYRGVTPKSFAERISQAAIAYVVIRDEDWNAQESTEHLINAMLLNGWTLGKSNFYSVSFTRTLEQVNNRLKHDSNSHIEFE